MHALHSCVLRMPGNKFRLSYQLLVVSVYHCVDVVEVLYRSTPSYGPRLAIYVYALR